ncbi:dTDP-4-dehydrorhamnose 3,5-epimerase family protein [Ilumatobacter sp.]|uniref:dTDP-4-dehydrorhamnose 3,5-epimerase family protein n=1 Tax=Ilumatobacter sp. TaxID=1967498 RepID=UPI003AF6620A
MIDFELAAGDIEGLLVITLKQISDDRGTIRELFRRSAFEAAGVTAVGTFSQVNITETRLGAIRGMHAEDMNKLSTMAAGEAFGAYVDVRPESATYGAVATIMLRPGVEVFVPSGVANGFQSLTEASQYVYCFDQEWQPGMPGLSCNPLDPELAIDWPLAIDPDDPSRLSAKDRSAPMFSELGGVA